MRQQRPTLPVTIVLWALSSQALAAEDPITLSANQLKYLDLGLSLSTIATSGHVKPPDGWKVSRDDPTALIATRETEFGLATAMVSRLSSFFSLKIGTGPGEVSVVSFRKGGVLAMLATKMEEVVAIELPRSRSKQVKAARFRRPPTPVSGKTAHGIFDLKGYQQLATTGLVASHRTSAQRRKQGVTRLRRRE
jgi:hypothetical protein